MMYTVEMFDEMVFDAVVVFKGTLSECREYVANAEENLCIVAPDGFTTIEQ